jgi:hypothetical protein
MKRLVILAVLSACAGTTGGEIVDFPAVVSGAAGATDFTNDKGWHIVLMSAKLHLGAVYLVSSLPVSGAQNQDCILPSTYVAQLTTGLDVDLLSASPQKFPTLGHGTTLAARAAQVWLTGGDVDNVDDKTPILEIQGTADRAGDVRPFFGRIIIGKNHQAGETLAPGAHPICKERIVSPIPTSLTVQKTGGLHLTIDARQLFVNAELGDLAKSGNTWLFDDEPGTDAYTQPSINLYQNLKSGGSLYTFSWDP